MSAASASRSPACARRTSAGLGSAMRHPTSVGRMRATISCAGCGASPGVIALQQQAPGCRLMEHETILHARRERRHARVPPEPGGTCMGAEFSPPPAPTPPAYPPSPPPPPRPRRLTRSSRERMWAGVAGGMAEYFDLDPSLVRLLWIAATVVSGGLAGPLYILAWIILPRDDRAMADSAHAWRDW